MTKVIYYVEVTVRVEPYGDCATDRIAHATRQVVKLKAEFVRNKKGRPIRARNGTYQVHLRREENLPALGYMLGRHGIVVVSHRLVTGNGILPPHDNTLAK